VEPPGNRVRWRESPAAFAHVVADLRARGARTIVCEGGPTVYAHVLDLATDFSLTVAPNLVSGEASLFHPSLRGKARDARLADVTAIGDHVFVHYTF
jgi:riboflavin biosynthesis pyrimidine reductase